MKKITPLLFVLFSFGSPVVFGEENIQFVQSYSRGDDDLAFAYSTATLNTSLSLKKVASGYDARVSFTAILSTAEAQGFAESVRFGMREAERFVTPAGQQAKAVSIATQPVVFKFSEPQIQQAADALSNQAMRSGQGVPGNRPEAMGKALGGTLALGTLTEGEHRGTIFVQQLVGQAPSATDTDISVRHLIRWHAKVQNGQVYVEVQNGRYFASDAGLEIAAPSWDGTVRPHRVALLSDQVVIDGHTLANGNARYGAAYAEKGATLLERDKAEFRREFNARERAAIRRGKKR